jgi:predicted lipase
MPSESAIYVVFRGSTSIADWVNNLDAVLTDYPRCSKCKVHKGFYKAQQSVISYITSSVQALRQKYPSYTVIVTGHSLGAAVATLTAIDLQESGMGAVRLFNFGSPRVGNDEFAAWTSTYISDRNRVTHYKDMVPHVPMHERFTHISGEWYEDQDHSLHQCNGYEDNNCSYQWHITNIDDHMHYLNLYMGCDAVSLEFPLTSQ